MCYWTQFLGWSSTLSVGATLEGARHTSATLDVAATRQDYARLCIAPEALRALQGARVKWR